ncbi:probable sphingolipid transporter spinster homolog 2 isoform X2 [Olea europaea var. sylvestris]|uniref:probable sphingolipid transporter spinster homolog 2 isoform X2 n=1 Tax=Olea europaea var. sylvestris TaxID=158386 RepID=UPI000C1D2DB8|nr:probable sphingolipid transporter spinster homolog 2 isoform X2 [Olea europaea var. sylvestris]
MGEEHPLPSPPRPVEGHLTPKPPSGAGSVEKVKSMDVDPVPSPISAPKPSWFTPIRLLVIFCVINLINYLDRGAIASNGVNGSRKTCTKNGKCSPGTGIQGDFDLNNFTDGVVSSAFMVGLLVASPMFASLTKSEIIIVRVLEFCRVNPFRLIGVGLSVWTIATAGCGFSKNFWSIAIFRMLVGVGEASFISLAAPFIDDNAPPAKKTFWLGAFYMCIPTGIAVGYVYGGLCGGYNWRLAFWVEAVLMLPFAILGFVMKPLQLKGFSPVGSKTALTYAEDGTENQGGELSSREAVADQNSKRFGSTDARNECIVIRFLKDMKILLLDQVYIVNVLGAYSYWGPKAGYNIYHMKNADYTFGGITVICGILGSLAGGFALDYMTSTISNAFKLLSMTTLFGAIFCLAAFCFKSLIAYVIIFSIGELLIFATQAPVNFVCLHCVTPSLRPLSMAMSTVCIHIFGDVPSSPLVGLLQDHLNNWRKTALILTSILFVAAAIWFIGIFLHSVDRFNEESKNPVTTTDKSNTITSAEVKKKTETA